jgi:hypothetical protein
MSFASLICFWKRDEEGSRSILGLGRRNSISFVLEEMLICLLVATNLKMPAIVHHSVTRQFAPALKD